ncbi:hypothetical protein ACHQM5_030415 [Ranunculus cassubicifolius]
MCRPTRVVERVSPRSGALHRETISRQFNLILDCVLQLYKPLIADHLQAVHGSGTSSRIRTDPQFAHYFKDCLGALDGTHINATVPIEEQDRFRGRKHRPTQNVLAACCFDLKFTYVLAGWEGTAHDQKVLDDALVRSNPFVVPRGKYYLVDAGYTNQPGFLAPYRGISYHLINNTKKKNRRTPQNDKELFNTRHAHLRTTIERAFGVLKKRWPLLSADCFYPYKTQVKIALACFILHNHVMGIDPNDAIVVEADKDLAKITTVVDPNMNQPTQKEENARWAQARDSMAKKMFLDFKNRINLSQV